MNWTKINCDGCNELGFKAPEVTSPDDALNLVSIALERIEGFSEADEGLIFQYEDENLCFLCLCSFCNYCVSCLSEAEDEVAPDLRCRAAPKVCERCLDKPIRNHLHECYTSGCMTPEEFAEECALLDQAGELDDDY